MGRRDVALGQAQPVVPSEPRPDVALVDLLRSAPRRSESVVSASASNVFLQTEGTFTYREPGFFAHRSGMSAGREGVRAHSR